MYYSWWLQEPLWRKEYSGSKSFKSLCHWGDETAHLWIYILLFLNSYGAHWKPPWTSGIQRGSRTAEEAKVTGSPALCLLLVEAPISEAAPIGFTFHCPWPDSLVSIFPEPGVLFISFPGLEKLRWCFCSLLEWPRLEITVAYLSLAHAINSKSCWFYPI